MNNPVVNKFILMTFGSQTGAEWKFQTGTSRSKDGGTPDRGDRDINNQGNQNNQGFGA